MKVSATLKGRKDAHGRLTVTIRIAEGSKRKFQATTIRVKPSDFGGGRVKPSHPDHALLNHKILELIMKAEREGFNKRDVLTFSDYADHLLSSWKNTKGKETIKHYRSALNKFNAFRPGLLLTQLDHKTLQAYQDHCYALGNGPNTVWNTLRFIRMITLRALKEGKIDLNPFNLYQMPKYKDPKRNFITEDQMKDIDKVRKAKDTPAEIRFAATWFLIGCYTGLRYGDKAAFNKKKNIRGDRLIVYTSKTGEPVGMPLSPQLKELFESIDYSPMTYTNTHYNRLIKQAAELAGIEDKLTAHISRHSAAVRWANAGISQEVTGKLLGHTNLKTTSVYYKITSKRIDDELKKIK